MRAEWFGAIWSAADTRRASRSAKRTSPPPSRTSGGDEKPDTESFEYKMQPIVLIVPRGSAPAAIETRKKEAEALRARMQTCDEANAFFKSMQNAAIREAVIKTSADIPPSLREVLDGTPIGHLTPPELTKQGVEMVALCGKEADHGRHAEKEGDPGEDVSPKNTRQSRNRTCRKSAEPR